MLGNDIVRKYRIIQNDAHDRNTHILIGRTKNGNEIQLNKEFLNCEQKILTGLIEPHFFAGFSGGGKAVMPGLAFIETVIHNHSAMNIDHPMATWGITGGNPIWEDIREAALMTEPVFLLNVTLNRKKEITGVFAGDIDKAYEKGCRFVRDNVMIPVEHSFDVVITSNSGYPLDLNLYQCVKGMSAAFQVVKPGGSIIIAGECWDGIPEHGSYGKLLRSVSNPDELLNKIRSPGFYEADMWQAQIQALICQQAEVYVYSTGLSENQIRDAMLKPCKSIEDTVNKLREKYGNSMSICILPEGPQTIPYIRNSQTRKQSKKV